MEFINAKKEHIKNIAEIFSKSHSGKPSLALAEKTTELYMKSAEEFILAKEGSKIIGFVCALKSPYELLKNTFSPDEFFGLPFVCRYGFSLILPSMSLFFKNPYVSMLAVAEEHRNKGIGTKLFYELFSRLAKKGFSEIYCDVAAGNQQIVRVCEKTGFKLINPLRSKIFNTEIRRKDLKSKNQP